MKGLLTATRLFTLGFHIRDAPQESLGPRRQAGGNNIHALLREFGEEGKYCGCILCLFMNDGSCLAVCFRQHASAIAA